MTPAALTIAGSDPSGGAGLQADLKTFHQHGVYGMSVVTLITVQNTVSVSAVEPLEPDLVAAQLEAVLADIPPAAAKTGALGTAKIIRAIAERAGGFSFPLVVDPVMISKHGAPLMSEDAGEVLKTELLPHTFLAMPNLPEAEALSGIPIHGIEDMEQAAKAIASLGPAHVLVKGGHLDAEAVDVLYSEGDFNRFSTERIASRNTHGTGCVLSASVTANLALGMPLLDAVRLGKSFISRAIETAEHRGNGIGPVNLHAIPPARG